MVSELIAAIEADPHDEASQLVIADYLQAEGDPRGDLIILDHTERRGRLDDPAALDQLLLLAAEYSFPRADPNEPMLPFVRTSQTTYEVVHGAYRYTLEHEDSRWDSEYMITVDPLEPPLPDPDGDDTGWPHYHFLDLHVAYPWTDDQENLILTIVGDVIRADTPFEGLRFPFNGILSFPQYPGSPLRCYMVPIDFLIAHDSLRNRFGLAARDYRRWHAIWDRLRAMQRR